MPSQAADQHGDSLQALCADLTNRRHVIVASNRGPVSFTQRRSGSGVSARTDTNPSTGALAPLEGVLPLTWISAASGEADRLGVEEAADGRITRGMPPGWSGRFIFPSRRAHHRFYNVICNPLLWFLHHRAWGFTHTPNFDREAHDAWDRGMVEVSAGFARAIADEGAQADRPVAVLLRDYHMCLAGGMTRELLPGAAIHYMVDVPWPEPGDWLMAPPAWREQIMRSMLACDVAGFSSNRDARSFLRCVEDFFPAASVSGPSVELDGHVTNVCAYVPGIQHDALLAAADSGRTQAQEEEIAGPPGVHTFVTAERAEPHKNIVRCLRAYGTLLDRDPALASSTRYLLTLAPPPPHLSQYRRYLDEIERTASDVNRKHGKSGIAPVQLRIENNYPLALAALRLADTVISVPIAEAQSVTALSAPVISDRDCSLIISETCGAAEIFGDEAMKVSPADVEALTGAMAQALSAGDSARRERAAGLQAAAMANTAEASVRSQVRDLLAVASR
jgi:trehalose 6-phosphate synthase